MAEHFKFFPTEEDVVTPWNAQYSYPSQANKATKLTTRIPPKNGAIFNPGQPIRLEFPAQGYVNPLNTHLEFDVVMVAPTVTTGGWAVRFQNNIQSLFSRIRLLYGAQSFEDIQQYGLLVRFLTETTATSQCMSIDQGSIADGIGGTSWGVIPTPKAAGVAVFDATGAGGIVTITVVTPLGLTATVGGYITLTGFVAPGVNGVYVVTATSATTISFISPTTVFGVLSTAVITPTTIIQGAVNTRQAYIQGLEGGFTGGIETTIDAGFEEASGAGHGLVPNGSLVSTLPGGATTPTAPYSVRRYMVNFALGLFTQDKLIPTKYMASQLALEITLDAAQNCMFMPVGFTNPATGASNMLTPPNYQIGNVNLITEIIEFDETYDAEFLKGLTGGGVPLKFSSWHYFYFNTAGSSTANLQITERSRSVKGLLNIQRRGMPGFQYDSHACFYDTNSSTSNALGSTLQTYQYRIGGRFFPGAPVQNSLQVGGSITNGGAESYLELAKFMNIVGDSRLKTNINTLNWAVPAIITGPVNLLSEYDYVYFNIGYSAAGTPVLSVNENTFAPFAGNVPSSMYACAINFETSNGIEVSGLNAEEQSDISFNVLWSGPQAANFALECFSFVDLLLVLRPNNYADIIQ